MDLRLRYPRDDLVYLEVSDADPAVGSLAWPRSGMRPIVQAFIELVRRAAPSAPGKP